MLFLHKSFLLRSTCVVKQQTIHENFPFPLTRESVLWQWVESPSGDSCLPFSFHRRRGKASQCVLRLGGALVPQRRVRFQRRNVADRRAKKGLGKLGWRGWKAGWVRRPETNCCVGQVCGNSTHWSLEETQEYADLDHSWWNKRVRNTVQFSDSAKSYCFFLHSPHWLSWGWILTSCLAHP